MREVNFSIPSANKASVGITTALYDRRALDCTSTLPLINSLNHLAYLTTSSARIRDILTIDGGIERLVVILKEGRSKDLMSMWKWNLAFQCVVNIGVRGSEKVRTRVVEADMVPVIATILDNYIRVVDRVTKRSAAAAQGSRARENRGSSSSSSFTVRRPGAAQSEIPPQVDIVVQQRGTSQVRYPQATNARHHHHTHTHTHHQQDNRPTFPYVAPREFNGLQPLPTMDTTLANEFGLQPVRDADRLPSMLSVGGASQPVSPTTPGPTTTANVTPLYNDRVVPRAGRPSVRRQRSISGESDEAGADEMGNQAPVGNGNEPIVDIQSDMDMDMGGDAMLESVDEPMTLALPGTDSQDEGETFNITHRSPVDGSIINPTGPVNTALGGPAVNQPLSIAGSLQMVSRYTMDAGSTSAPTLPSSMPREEDVLMSLQLLAYVSKYCNLRSYFQQSHLVPRLMIEKELHLLDEETGRRRPPPVRREDEMEEYLLPDDFNVFPLVEKFTVRHHPSDMQYWAGVVMRNLCRKDDSKGGIRQCAYYECGKWEEFTRQFAKCRRCRRTKYCSKDCQKSAWVYHRHWCVAATTDNGA
ncbi:hypothetical protein BZA05DRAFT_144424 [Tricharina praecox]|uniref:uncharacterized protein n=1 Tax=Tricharina praecox TaxID=43433 RepID=UPI00222103EC|nr:uncharacterized protein BZA05DRAFT_144424 [Tricharina praecox]KAI5845994.1 hypothetical protein BZA05DRAFT_144424 [Tricharina praecox]